MKPRKATQRWLTRLMESTCLALLLGLGANTALGQAVVGDAGAPLLTAEVNAARILSQASQQRERSREEVDVLSGRQGRWLNLADYKGNTFLEFMTVSGGLKDNINQDHRTRFEVVTKEAVRAAAVEMFDPGVYRKVLRFFKRGAQGLDQVVDALAGQEFTPATITGAIREQFKSNETLLNKQSEFGLAPLVVAPLLSIASGAGTWVRINDKNSYVNFGYKPDSNDEEELAAALKSGRSFGVSPRHLANDASDTRYLTDLGNYLSTTSDVKGFYRNMFKVLTDCNPSGHGRLSEDGQSVATDFFAIYSAELYRHLMVDLDKSKRAWENDLTEATLISAYVAKSGMVLKLDEKDGKVKFVDGDPTNFFGVGEKGSGIGGKMRRVRRQLQRAVCDAERRLSRHRGNTSAIEKIEKIIGAVPDGDVIKGVMAYINSPMAVQDEIKSQDDIKSNAAALAEAVAEFEADLQDDAEPISEMLAEQFAESDDDDGRSDPFRH